MVKYNTVHAGKNKDADQNVLMGRLICAFDACIHVQYGLDYKQSGMDEWLFSDNKDVIFIIPP